MTDLPERLRSAADAHRPDRERMLARVEHAMAEDRAESGARGHDRPPAAPWMRVTAVTAAVAGAIGIGGLAVGAVTGDRQPAGTVVTSAGASTRSPTPASGSPGSADGRVPVPRHGTTAPGHHRDTPATHESAGHTTSASSAPPPVSQGASPGDRDGPQGSSQPPAGDGPLTAEGVVDAGSNDYWTQSNVVLTASQTLTSMTVELRIATNNKETSTGSWSSVSGSTTAQVAVEGQDLVYRWTLNAGQTLSPGTYTFAGHFNHDAGQGGTDGDRYTVTAGYGSGGTAAVGGGF